LAASVRTLFVDAPSVRVHVAGSRAVGDTVFGSKPHASKAEMSATFPEH